MNWNNITQTTFLNLKVLFLTAAIAEEITKSPVINTDIQSTMKRPKEKGIVKIVIKKTTPKAKINTYAGTCTNFMIIAALAKEVASHFLRILIKKQAMLIIAASIQYKNSAAIRYKALASKTEFIM